MQTIQGKIDDVVFEVEGALKECPIPEGDKERILNGVKELGFNWQEANAHGRAACVLLGLIDDKYPVELARRFVGECVQLKQFEELQTKETEGSYYTFKMIPMPLYAALIDLLMVQAIEGKAGVFQERSEDAETGVELVYDPSIAEEYRKEQAAAAEKQQAEVLVAERIPDTDAATAAGDAAEKQRSGSSSGRNASAQKRTGRKNGPGVKTAEKIKAATNAPVKKTARKTGGAADGK